MSLLKLFGSFPNPSRNQLAESKLEPNRTCQAESFVKLGNSTVATELHKSIPESILLLRKRGKPCAKGRSRVPGEGDVRRSKNMKRMIYYFFLLSLWLLWLVLLSLWLWLLWLLLWFLLLLLLLYSIFDALLHINTLYIQCDAKIGKDC